jgi:ABC-type polysaccharide/polyol phosphate export permease
MNSTRMPPAPHSPAVKKTATPVFPVYDSARRGLPAVEELRELLRYRNLLWQMVRRDVVTRYKRSFLGIAWTMLNPLGTTLVLTIVFSQVFGVGGSYAAYVLSGLMPWTFFAQTTNACIVGLLWGGSLLNRIFIPRTVFAVSAIGTGLVNLALSLLPLLIVMIASGVPLKSTALLLPIPILFLAMFSLGVGLLLSALAIYFADIAEMYQIVLTAWFYLSPVIYLEELLPQKLLWIVHLNPMYYLINFFRAFIYDGRIPTAAEFLVAGGIAAITLLIGWVFFSQKADEFAYRV